MHFDWWELLGIKKPCDDGCEEHWRLIGLEQELQPWTTWMVSLHLTILNSI